jgi:alkylation response protein AidB-like acyl-CoA dehydrogenase
MNFELSDEQRLLADTARGALARQHTLSNARAALDGAPVLDLWPSAVELGWPGIMVPPEAGGAGLGVLEAMLVLLECGRTLAPLALAEHVVATDLVARSGAAAQLLQRLAGGDLRATAAVAEPPSALHPTWKLPDEAAGEPPRADLHDGSATLDGSIPAVRGAADAHALVAIAVTASGGPVALIIDADGPGVAISPDPRFDPTCPLDRVVFRNANATVLSTDASLCARAWYCQQALSSAESLGAAEALLAMSVAYAKERTAFGRAIGSYQAIKHLLVEMLRKQENARSLIYYAGWAFQDAHAEIPLAASAARVAASQALDFSAREAITVHGGIGVTWEHDAPLYFRRAQIARRLYGGLKGAATRVAEITLASVAHEPIAAITPETGSLDRPRGEAR